LEAIVSCFWIIEFPELSSFRYLDQLSKQKPNSIASTNNSTSPQFRDIDHFRRRERHRFSFIPCGFPFLGSRNRRQLIAKKSSRSWCRGNGESKAKGHSERNRTESASSRRLALQELQEMGMEFSCTASSRDLILKTMLSTPQKPGLASTVSIMRKCVRLSSTMSFPG
jgi:hypothetical protein